MRGDVTFEIDGQKHTARLTLGALEEIQLEGYAPGVVFNALATGIYTPGELGATLRAGLAVTGENLTSDELVAALGGTEAVKIAVKLLALFFDPDDSGNVLAAVDGNPKAAASSDSS